jgi:hypothetical protein
MLTMAVHESDTTSGSPAEESPLQGRIPATGQGTQSRGRPIGRLAIFGGLLSGLLAFGVGELLYKLIPPERVPRDLMGSKIMVPSLETVNVAATKNAALAFGALGLCLAGTLGIVGGLAQRQPSSSARGGLVGLVMGLAVGAGTSLAVIPLSLEAQLDYPDYDLILSLAMHALIWGLLGASAGLALAAGIGERRLIAEASIAGFVGAVLAAVVFELIGAACFGLAETGKPISATWPTRLLARLLVTVGTTLALATRLASKPEGPELGYRTESRPPSPSVP